MLSARPVIRTIHFYANESKVLESYFSSSMYYGVCMLIRPCRPVNLESRERAAIYVITDSAIRLATARDLSRDIHLIQLSYGRSANTGWSEGIE